MGEVSRNYLAGVTMLNPRSEILEHYGVKGMRWGQRRAFRNSLAGMKTRTLRRMEEGEYKKLFKAETAWNRVKQVQRREKIASVLAGKLGRKGYNAARQYRLANRTKWGLIANELGKRDFKAGKRTDRKAGIRSSLGDLDNHNNDGTWKRTSGMHKTMDYWKPVKSKEISVVDKIGVPNRLSSFHRQYRRNELDKDIRAEQRYVNSQNGGKTPRFRKSKMFDVVRYG